MGDNVAVDLFFVLFSTNICQIEGLCENCKSNRCNTYLITYIVKKLVVHIVYKYVN